MIALEAFSAKEGDALLLHYEDDSGPRYAIIDGGPAGVFTDVVAPRLAELDPTNNGLRIEFASVSHVDGDHVDGVLDWFEEMTNNVGAGSDVLFWNSPRAMPAPAQPAGGQIKQPKRADLEKLIATLTPGKAMAVKVQSYKTGTQLDGLATDAGTSINPPHGSRLIAGDVLPDDIVGPLKIKVTGPSIKVLEKMLLKWQKTAPIDVTPQSIDTSVTNLSSLVLHVRAGKSKTMLLCGDARADHILQGLADAGFAASPEKPLKVSILKVPHHGSDRNAFSGPLAKDKWKFFESVLAKHYVFSADGRFDNPSPATVQHVVEVNKTRGCDLWFTTDPATLSDARAKAYNKALKAARTTIDKHHAPVTIHHPVNGQRSVLIKL
jgi:hypothetical protein